VSATAEAFIIFFFFHGPTAPSGAPHSLGFAITLKPNTLGRTSMEEWSAKHGELYLKTHNTDKRQDIRVPGEIRTRSPSKRVAADPRIRTSGHWERLIHYHRRSFPISCWCQAVSCVLYQPSCCICHHPRDNIDVWCRHCFLAALQTDDKHSEADITDMAKISVRYFVTKWNAL